MSDFYYTWSRQSDIPQIELAGAAEDQFLLADGSRIYDFISTSFQASFGHSNRSVIDRVVRQTESLSIAPPKASFRLKETVSRGLIDMIGMGGGKVFYTVSGAEAVENALKMARRITGRPVVLSRRRSYHGASLGAMSVSGDWRSHEHLNFSQGTERIPEPDEDPFAEGAGEVVRRVGAERIAAIIVETISGTNGVAIPPTSWLEGLRNICDENGLCLILDEVLVGFYRCGSAFAFQGLAGRPDMVCMSKALTGGYIPMGAVWTSPKIAQFYENHVLTGGLTSYAHPLGLAAIEGVLELIGQPSFAEERLELERVFQELLGELAERFGATALRCRGMLAALEFANCRLPSPHDFWLSGLHLYCKDQMIILAPPLISKPARLREAFGKLAAVLDSSAVGRLELEKR
jgi:taurine---2-oxoglutarate transaminase